MRKGRDGGKTGKKKEKKKEKTDENSGHYVIASSRPPERRPLERRTLAPIWPRLQAVVVKVKPGNGQSLDEADTNWGNGFVWSINFIIVFIFKYV